MRTCSKCGDVKPDGDFYPRMGRCKDCHMLTCVAWQKAHPRKLAEIQRRYYVKNTDRQRAKSRNWVKKNTEYARVTQMIATLRDAYGMTLDQYHAMQERQDFACAVCGDDSRNLYVDHDHNTGKVRGGLCNTCNRALGLLKDDPAVLTRAAAYLTPSEQRISQ